MGWLMLGRDDGPSDDFRVFTTESMEAALQATEWKKRDMYLRLALMWGTAAQQCRKEASTLPETQSPSLEPSNHD